MDKDDIKDLIAAIIIGSILITIILKGSEFIIYLLK